MLELFEDEYHTFTKQQEMQAIYNLFSELTNNRPLGNKTLTRMNTVVGGYGKIMGLVAKYNPNK